MKDKILHSEIMKCNNSAFLVPTHLSSYYAEGISVASSDISQFIDIGVETFVPSNHVFLFREGFLPLRIIIRMRALQQSFVLEHWQNLVREHTFRPYVKPTNLKVPSMSGNILLIFVLFIAGNLTGFVIWVFEHRKLFRVKILRYGRLLLSQGYVYLRQKGVYVFNFFRCTTHIPRLRKSNKKCMRNFRKLLKATKAYIILYKQ